ncbi:serine hydrolase [Clostridium sediminicola]|uniref:serine hydrolase domain-containing protein n=1 Tax=Clostridium sediminicola TaxID=3114879 RepID=UPI0031F24D99
MYNEERLIEVKEKMDTTNFSGVVSIKVEDKIVLEEARGYLERANEIPNKATTIFGIASGAKLFTSLGIMRLVEKEMIKLDDLAFEYVPFNYPTYDKTVTIKQLLTHTSGIPDYFDEEFIADFDNFRVSVPWNDLLKPSEYLEIMPHREMKFTPGTKFSYNNSAFVFLAVIIEKLTGDYHEWIKKEVLERADMKDSGFFMLDRLPSNCANGYVELENGKWRTNIYNLPIIGGGDGGIFTTANDLIKFWENLMDGNIIDKDLLEQLLTPHVKEEKFGYGLGVWLAKEGEDFVPYIMGEDAGVSFKSYHNSKKNITYSVLSNTIDGAWEITPLLK